MRLGDGLTVAGTDVVDQGTKTRSYVWRSGLAELASPHADPGVYAGFGGAPLPGVPASLNASCTYLDLSGGVAQASLRVTADCGVISGAWNDPEFTTMSTTFTVVPLTYDVNGTVATSETREIVNTTFL